MHWTYDTAALARGTAQALLDEGRDSWFFVTADNQFGHQLEADVRRVLAAGGGSVLGEARHPVNGIYFSPYLLGSAQPSGAKAVALATSGSDAVTAIKEAYEFGVMQSGQQLVGLMLFISDVRQLGLYMAGGLKLTTGFYWNFDEATREWGRRFHQRAGFMPTMVQAGTYSALMHYFKAVDALGSDEGRAVVDKMKSMPVNDFFARNGSIRGDGRMVHDMLLVEVKRASESVGAWDYYKVLRIIPGDQAFRPMAEGACPYLH